MSLQSLTPITLGAAIESFSGKDLYGESDGLGLASQYLTYDVGIKDPEVKIEKAQVNEKAINKLADDAIKDLKKMKENI